MQFPRTTRHRARSLARQLLFLRGLYRTSSLDSGRIPKRPSKQNLASPIWSGSSLATPACPMTGNMATTLESLEFAVSLPELGREKLLSVNDESGPDEGDKPCRAIAKTAMPAA